MFHQNWIQKCKRIASNGNNGIDPSLQIFGQRTFHIDKGFAVNGMSYPTKHYSQHRHVHTEPKVN